MIADYLPKLKYSAYVEFLTDLKKYVDPIRLDCEWKRFKLFESKVHNNGRYRHQYMLRLYHQVSPLFQVT